MTYNQYSTNAQTGATEAGKNRLSSNSNDSGSDLILWPSKFDLLSNKVNDMIIKLDAFEQNENKS